MEPQPSTDALLESVLRDFGDKVNAHPRLRSLLAGWDRITEVNAVDTGHRFVVRFEDSKVTEIRARLGDDAADPAPDVDIRAPADLLRAIFSGRENPTQLFLEGTLQVFASDMDQVKLDAITLVLWD